MTELYQAIVHSFNNFSCILPHLFELYSFIVASVLRPFSFFGIIWHMVGKCLWQNRRHSLLLEETGDNDLHENYIIYCVFYMLNSMRSIYLLVLFLLLCFRSNAWVSHPGFSDFWAVSIRVGTWIMMPGPHSAREPLGSLSRLWLGHISALILVLSFWPGFLLLLELLLAALRVSL